MNKITIKEKVKRTNYYEVSYIFILDVPKSISDKTAAPTTKEVGGSLSIGEDATLKDIQEILVERYNKEQLALNTETTFDVYGMTWDGKVWV
jgi:hypothetical protein